MAAGRPRERKSVAGTLPRGSLGVGRLEAEYIIKLDRLARKWGCEPLSEAALELLKDAIDEGLKDDIPK